MQFAHLHRVRTADAEFERPADRRAKLQRAYPWHDLLELRLSQGGEDALLHAGADVETFGDDDGLREEVIGELLVERQVEADGAAANIERPVLDVGVGLQDLLEVIDHLARRVDRGALAAA